MSLFAGISEDALNKSSLLSITADRDKSEENKRSTYNIVFKMIKDLYDFVPNLPFMNILCFMKHAKTYLTKKLTILEK